MAAAGDDFDSWLSVKLRALNTDENVFGSYIKGILDGEETLEEKMEALEGILTEIIENDISNHCREILQEWQKSLKADRIADGECAGCGSEVDVTLAKFLESQPKSVAVQRTYTDEERKIREAILAQYSQVARAEQMATGAGRKAMLWFLLKKQLQLMSRIEQLWRQAVAEEARKPRLLDATTEVRRWTGYKRLAVSMETLEVQQAWQLRELHRALGEDLASGERAELLVCLRQAFSHLGGGSARELVRLLDRECHFLAMGLGAPRLAGLRARIEQVFLDVVRDPRVNPQVATLRAAEQGRVPQRDVVRCDRCLKFKHYSKFPLGNLTKMVSCCSACQWLEVAGRTRVDLGPYRNIARAVRRDEQRQAAYCSVAFVMSDDDFYLLVDNIWQGHSAISSSGDLKLLRLCRWDTESLWSPWNCILLTADEAKAHCSSNSSPGEIYEDNFKEKVIHRHAIAKLQFKHLARHDQACLDTQETVGID